MADARVICLGEILFDYLATELGKPYEEVSNWRALPGGAPANVATALVKLGTNSAFIGCIGQDRLGDDLVSLLNQTGVNTLGVQRHPAPTRQVYITRSEVGEPQFAKFSNLASKAANFADTYLRAELLPEKLFLQADYLVVGSIGLAYQQTSQAVWRALQLAEHYHLKVILDVNWRPIFWSNTDKADSLIKSLIKYVDFIKLTNSEAQWLFNTSDPGKITYSLGSVEGVLITQGVQPVKYCICEQEGQLKPISVKVEDPTGAGDAFVAGFVHQLCQSNLQELNQPTKVKEIVRYACAVASLTTTKLGAMVGQPTAEDVEKFLAVHQ